MAQKMGGLVISQKHENVAPALVSFAGERGITHIAPGHPGPKKLLQWYEESLHETFRGSRPTWISSQLGV